jgi:ribulose bisphosphate carboxylase small subunit
VIAPWSITIPQCCREHRIAAFDVLDALVANDTAAQVTRLVDDGWRATPAIETVRSTYRSWLLGRIADAVEHGVGLAAVELGVDPSPTDLPCPVCSSEAA